MDVTRGGPESVTPTPFSSRSPRPERREWSLSEPEREELESIRWQLERLTFERTHRDWDPSKVRAYEELAVREMELLGLADRTTDACF
jgi:hypothetical protein